MTANPVRPARYRPGKGQDASSDSEYETEEEIQEEKPKPKPKSAPSTSRVTGAFQEVNLSERRKQEAARLAAQNAAAREINEDEFETESEGETAGGVKASGDKVVESSEAESSGSGEDEGSEEESEEESSSEDEAPAKLLRPTFIRKNQRDATKASAPVQSEEQTYAESESRRKAKADTVIQEQLERNAAMRAAEKKAWDDSDVEDVLGGTEAEVDDTDGLDLETEKAAWKLRELKRVKRARAAIEDAEAERAELERRRNLTVEEREAEDAVHLDKQKEEREGRGKAGYMSRYFHKGAFFNDDEYAKAQGLDKRDIMGARYVDQISDKAALPEFLQVRDATKVGKKGRTKYKDLRNEDTGQWGEYRDGRRERDGTAGGADGLDERFRSDRSRERTGPTGANATAVGVKRDRLVDAPTGPKPKSRFDEQPKSDLSRKNARSKSRSRSPPPRRDTDRDRNGYDRRRSYSRSRSPPPRRRDSRDRDRDRDRNYRRSVSPRRERRDSRDRYRDRDKERDRDRRKRSPSPYRARYEDKRQRVY